MDWYGVPKKIITLDFPGEKEVILFECDWYDVPATTKNKSRGSVVRMKPRTLFSMPELEKTKQQGHIDIDSLDIVDKLGKNDLQGVTRDANIIEKAIPMPEPNDEDLVDQHEDSDDTYINDGHVAPVNSLGQGQDDEFFT
uniref:DUF4216 domain-containing protein n=1 Tax=Setaria viridis TaxID=4556 RepID=A0A4U6UGZ5_SETVI|nr:hypothetical protein SEVIR_5G180500v2 [Setaria viridis]